MIAASEKGTRCWPSFICDLSLVQKGICIHPERLYQMPGELMVKMDIHDIVFEEKSIS